MRKHTYPNSSLAFRHRGGPEVKFSHRNESVNEILTEIDEPAVSLDLPLRDQTYQA